MNSHTLAHVHRIAAVFLSAALIVANGCEDLRQTVGRTLAETSKPTVRLADSSLRDISLDRAALDLDLEITNPYSVALPIVGADFALSSNDQQFLTGRHDTAQTIPAGKSKMITVPVDVRFRELVSAVAGVRPGAIVPYRADVDLNVDAPGFGPLSLPLKHEGKVPVPAVPEVAIGGITFDELSLSRAAATVDLNVRNTNQFDATLAKMSYALDLAGVRVGEGGVPKAMNLPAGRNKAISIPLSFKPMDFGTALFNSLTGGNTDYAIAGDISLDTRFGTIALPYSKNGSTAVQR